MKDRLGRIWLIGIVGALIVLSVSLWWQGARRKEPARETYLWAEAQKHLGCSPYLLNKGLHTDINENGAVEYLFSCDSALSDTHTRFIWLEILGKQVQVLLYHTEEGWKVGGRREASSGVSWLLDRRRRTLLVLVPENTGSFAVPTELVWDPQDKCIRLEER
ncbi:MAG: hypothetical protein N2170_08880 [Bacteroidia bacterium]|nr:hypothetical protein [Bacteroidia bacterium]